ncbi:MBL fold metallo-hydrolase [Oscillospiraceae bacterium 38-13]
MTITVLLEGISGQTERGWLGWSSVILLQSGGKNILYDTGAYNDRPKLVERLHNCYLAPSDIHAVIVSHLHFDHIANIDLFSNAVWSIHENELERTGELLNPSPEPYRRWILQQPNLKLISNRCCPVHPGIDVILTPGHTPGSCSALVKADKPVLLAGDTIKDRQDLARVRTLAGEQLRELLKQAEVIIPGHDCPLLPDGNPLKKTTVHWIETAAQMEVRHGRPD